ncbi:hypothetical protein EON65_56395, partial [archaeon]
MEKSLEEEVGELRVSLAQVKEDAKTKISKAIERIKELRTEISTKDEELTQCRNKLSAFEASKTEGMLIHTGPTYDELQSENKTLKHEVETLREESKNKLLRAVDKIKGLSTELEAEKQKSATLQQEKESVVLRIEQNVAICISEANNNIKNLSAELEEVKKAYEEEKAGKGSVSTELSELRERL